ncbi:hypothetical protein O181_036050 [Austropuccinia psidii MF-1]|uniref:CSC1/OSCA1-like 7TM region domain-containing protein n=1 Tax=Austropuccinia psidii MF-1 TaxID=1389203 RepID=A0A9Q3D5T4_9BASI|nr:hypothetical protein [Austropuccinia psidii MF-1]
MSSGFATDPLVLGIISNIVLAAVLISPLLWIFFRARAQPTSFFWKAVYVPRTWWPPDPNLRTHKIFDSLFSFSSFKFFIILLKGQPAPLVICDEASQKLQSNSNFTILTDEEIHLRFLALCLRIALLALLLGLPTFLFLFIFGVPPLPDSVLSSSLEDLTALRLLYQYDLSPNDYAPRFNAWVISALLIGSVLSLLLILVEWNYLRGHFERFSEEKCQKLQIVYLPRTPESGFDQVGEKQMVAWIQACGLGPIRGEGSRRAFLARKNSQPAPSSHTYTQSYPTKEKNKGDQLQTGLDSDEHDYPPLSPMFHIPSEQRALIIQGVFTVSPLNKLRLLAKQRRQVLNQLELNEAKYIAGFSPEEVDKSMSSRNMSKVDKKKGKAQNKNQDADLTAENVTPYGPAGQYKLETQWKTKVKFDWESQSLQSSKFETSSQVESLTPTLTQGGKPSLYSELHFCEIFDDHKLSNIEYQQKWAIGNQVNKNPDGTLVSVRSNEASHTEVTPGYCTIPFASLDTQASQLPSLSLHVDEEKSWRNQSLSPRDWPDSRSLTPSSPASTRDTHGYQLPPSTAPTSELLEPSDNETMVKKARFLPAKEPIRLDELFQKESSLEARPRLPRSTSVSNLKSILRLNSSTFLSDHEEKSIVPSFSRIEGSKYQLNHSNVNTNLLKTPLDLLKINQIDGKSHSKSSSKHSESLPFARPLVNLGNLEIPLNLNFSKRKPHRFMSTKELESLYISIRKNRSHLKQLNARFLTEKLNAVKELEEGLNGKVCGWILVGQGVKAIKGAKPIDGMTRDDVIWESLGKKRNVQSMYKRSSQTGGKIELDMIITLSLVVAFQSALIGVILFSRKGWVLTTLSFSMTFLIILIYVWMRYQGSNFSSRKYLPSASRKALEIFERGPLACDHKVDFEGKLEPSSSQSSYVQRRESVGSVMRLMDTALESFDIGVERTIPLPSETVDDLVDTHLALRTYPDAPPHLPGLPWRTKERISQYMLYPPVLLQTSPAVWLPKNSVAADEAAELKKYWDLDAFYEEGISTNNLNLG